MVSLCAQHKYKKKQKKSEDQWEENTHAYIGKYKVVTGDICIQTRGKAPGWFHDLICDEDSHLTSAPGNI